MVPVQDGALSRVLLELHDVLGEGAGLVGEEVGDEAELLVDVGGVALGGQVAGGVVPGGDSGERMSVREIEVGCVQIIPLGMAV